MDHKSIFLSPNKTTGRLVRPTFILKVPPDEQARTAIAARRPGQTKADSRQHI